MAKKPLQFHVSEKLKKDIDEWISDKDMTISEFMRQSAKLHMILKEYIDQGYQLVLKKKDSTSEKELILP